MFRDFCFYASINRRGSGTACKVVILDSGGSTPSAGTIFYNLIVFVVRFIFSIFVSNHNIYIVKKEILKLREEGNSYREIEKKLGCSRSTISYHCGAGQKKKSRERQKNNRAGNSLIRKVDKFKCVKNRSRDFQNAKNLRKKDLVKFTFSYKDVLKKFGKKPICYLTGTPIDLSDSTSYNFDHVVPVSKGGLSTLDNLGITTRDANQAKSDLSVEEFINLCIKVLEHNNYKVVKLEN